MQQCYFLGQISFEALQNRSFIIIFLKVTVLANQFPTTTLATASASEKAVSNVYLGPNDACTVVVPILEGGRMTSLFVLLVVPNHPKYPAIITVNTTIVIKHVAVKGNNFLGLIVLRIAFTSPFPLRAK